MSLEVTLSNHDSCLESLVASELNKKFRLGKKEDAITAYISRENETIKDKFKKISVRIVHLIKLRLITDKKCVKLVNKQFNDLSAALHFYYSNQITTLEGAKSCEVSIRAGFKNVQTISNLFKNTKIGKKVEDELNLKKWENLINELNARLDPNKAREDVGTSTNTGNTSGSSTENPLSENPPNVSSDSDSTKPVDQEAVPSTSDSNDPGKQTDSKQTIDTVASNPEVDSDNSTKNDSQPLNHQKTRIPPEKNDFVEISEQVIKKVEKKLRREVAKKYDLDDEFCEDIKTSCEIKTSKGNFQCTFQRNEEGEAIIINREDGVSCHLNWTNLNQRIVKHLKNGFDKDGYGIDGYARDGYNQNNIDRQGNDYYTGKKAFISQVRSKNLEQRNAEAELINKVFDVIQSSQTKSPHMVTRILVDAAFDKDQVYNELLSGKKGYDEFIEAQNNEGGIFHNAGIKVPLSHEKYMIPAVVEEKNEFASEDLSQQYQMSPQRKRALRNWYEKLQTPTAQEEEENLSPRRKKLYMQTI